MIPLAKAQKLAERVVEQLRPHSRRIEIAGSIRRGRPMCGDVDLVIQAGDRAAIEAIITARCNLEKRGDQYTVAVHRETQVQFDLWFSYTPRPPAQHEFFADSDRRPDNFGSLLLCRTGSTQHNITLCERAKRLDRHWNPHWGVYQQGVCVASATETDIYHALGLEFIAPDAREFATRAEQLRLVNSNNKDKAGKMYVYTPV